MYVLHLLVAVPILYCPFALQAVYKGDRTSYQVVIKFTGFIFSEIGISFLYWDVAGPPL